MPLKQEAKQKTPFQIKPNTSNEGGNVSGTLKRKLEGEMEPHEESEEAFEYKQNPKKLVCIDIGNNYY